MANGGQQLAKVVQLRPEEQDQLDVLLEGIEKLLSETEYFGNLDITIRVRDDDFEMEYEEGEFAEDGEQDDEED